MFYKTSFICLFFCHITFSSQQLDFRNGIRIPKMAGEGTTTHKFLRETEEAKEVHNTLFGLAVIQTYNQFMNGTDTQSFIDLVERGQWISRQNPYPFLVRKKARELFNLDWGKKCDYLGYIFRKDGTIFLPDPIVFKGAREEDADHIYLRPPFTPA